MKKTEDSNQQFVSAVTDSLDEANQIAEAAAKNVQDVIDAAIKAKRGS